MKGLIGSDEEWGRADCSCRPSGKRTSEEEEEMLTGLW